jgi:hypothetical protein
VKQRLENTFRPGFFQGEKFTVLNCQRFSWMDLSPKIQAGEDIVVSARGIFV